MACRWAQNHVAYVIELIIRDSSRPCTWLFCNFSFYYNKYAGRQILFDKAFAPALYGKGIVDGRRVLYTNCHVTHDQHLDLKMWEHLNKSDSLTMIMLLFIVKTLL
jgi:hypothetical protein